MTTCDHVLRRNLGVSVLGYPEVVDEPCTQSVGLRLIVGLTRDWHACRAHIAVVTARMQRADLEERVRHETRPEPLAAGFAEPRTAAEWRGVRPEIAGRLR